MSFALKQGLNVLHYTLELGESYVGRRYDACLTGIPVNTILEHRKEVEEAISDLPGKLIVKEYPTGRATVSTIKSHIDKCDSLGFKADIVLIDYVDLLQSKRKSKEKKEEIDDIYLNTKGMARELKIPIWSVSQVNRSGAHDEVIEGDKAAGSYDKMMIADVAISLSRMREDKEKNTGRFHLMKNRYGADGVTSHLVIDTSTGSFIFNKFENNVDDVPKTPSEKKNNFHLNGKTPKTKNVIDLFNTIQNNNNNEELDTMNDRAANVIQNSSNGSNRNLKTTTTMAKKNITQERIVYKPFEYPKAFDYWLKQQQAHWIHTEVPMMSDVNDWKQNLNETEKNIIGSILKGFAQTETVVNDYWTGLVTKWFRKPEIIAMATVFGSMETIHAEAYSLLNEELGLDDFSEFLEDEATMAKIEALTDVRDSFNGEVNWHERAKSLAIFSDIY